MITNEERGKIEKYLAGRTDIDVAYLFGSQSTGKATHLSDVDIAVLFENKLSKIERFKEKLNIMGEIGTLLKRNDIEVVDLNSADIGLRFSAIENRDILFVRNDQIRSSFEADTMTKYQDYKYYINRNTKVSLASIARMEI